MKRPFLLLASALLAATIAFAQEAPAAPSSPQAPAVQATGANAQVIRGCLSGSPGNYTLTDPNGMQYQVSGDDATLRSMVGHEVEITGAESASTAQADDTRPANGIEASDVRAVSNTCSKATPQSAAPPDNITPPPDRDSNVSPKGTPDAAAPPKPQLISMLQQQSAPDAGTQEPKTETQQKPGTRNSNPSSEMNAKTAAGAPPSAQPQVGNSPANETGMTENEANRDAQSARQSEINTNAQTGKDTGRGIENQGVNNPKQTNPSAVPQSRHSSSTGATAPSSTRSQNPEHKTAEQK